MSSNLSFRTTVYGLNGTGVCFPASGAGATGYPWQRVGSINNPSQIYLVADTAQILGSSEDINSTSYLDGPLYPAWGSSGFSDNKAYSTMHFRHSKKANICFADGHVKAEQLTITRSSFFSEADNLGKYFIGWFGKDFDDAQTWFTIKK